MNTSPLVLIRCNSCARQVATAPGEILLWVSPAEPREGFRAGAYAFVCPTCCDLVVRDADETAIEALLTADVVPLSPVHRL